jgi:hypothetical protein
VVGEDRLTVLGNFDCPPAAHPLKQADEAVVGRSVLAEKEARPVAARRDLAALTRPAGSPGNRVARIGGAWPPVLLEHVPG